MRYLAGILAYPLSLFSHPFLTVLALISLTSMANSLICKPLCKGSTRSTCRQLIRGKPTPRHGSGKLMHPPLTSLAWRPFAH